MRRRLTLALLIVLAVFFAPLGISVATYFIADAEADDWRTARRDSAGIAPPVAVEQAGIQGYCARAYRWRGAFGEHCWIAAKPTGTEVWTRFEVMGWQLRRGGQAIRIDAGSPDGYWYGARPTLLRAVQGGAEIDALIERLHAASENYPHKAEYRIWPGPNSNTYIAHLGRAVPELSLELPPTAIGKDYIPQGGLFARPASGSGLQFSLAGLFGLLDSPQEGVEMNVLGLSAGIDLSPPALKLPGLGRLGAPSQTLDRPGEPAAQEAG